MDARDVVYYFHKKGNKPQERIQKLLYYAQSVIVKICPYRLFNDEIEVNKDGPFVPIVWQNLNVIGGEAITELAVFMDLLDAIHDYFQLHDFPPKYNDYVESRCGKVLVPEDNPFGDLPDEKALVDYTHAALERVRQERFNQYCNNLNEVHNRGGLLSDTDEE